MKMQSLRILAAVVLAAVSLVAAEATVAGSWNLAVQAGHTFPIGLELKQDGPKVTGTLVMPDGETPLAGEFVDGALVLTGTMEGGPGHMVSGPIKITAKMQEDGTMSGEFAAGGGKMPWTAERLRKR